MNKELIDKIITYNYNEFGNEFGDCIVDMKKEMERLNNIINETVDKLNEMKISMLIDTNNGIEIDSKFVDNVFEIIKFLEESKELKGSDKE